MMFLVFLWFDLVDGYGELDGVLLLKLDADGMDILIFKLCFQLTTVDVVNLLKSE
jgi:hypothetical protein